MVQITATDRGTEASGDAAAQNHRAGGWLQHVGRLVAVVLVVLVVLGALGNMWEMSTAGTQHTEGDSVTNAGDRVPSPFPPSQSSSQQPSVAQPPLRQRKGRRSSKDTVAPSPAPTWPVPDFPAASTVDELIPPSADVRGQTLLKRALAVLHPPYEMGQLVNYCGHLYRPRIHMIRKQGDLEALGVMPPGVISTPSSRFHKSKHSQSQTESHSLSQSQSQGQTLPRRGDDDDVVWLSFFTESQPESKLSKQIMCDFVQNVQHLQRRVIVMTAGRWTCGSPWLIPSIAKIGCTTDALQHFMDHPKVLLWFLTQHDSAYHHEKMRPLPIGLFACFWDERHNKHSPFAQPVWTGTNPRTAVHKQAVVNVPYVPSLPPRDRWLYVNYQVHAGRDEVEDAFFAKLPRRPGADPDALRHSNAFRLEKEPGFKLAIHNYPLDMLSSQFVFSPAGAGEDCWRHWEILIHGGVPIIPGTWPLRMLFEGLPVVFYDEKGNLDSPSGSALNFTTFVEDVERGKYNYKKLTQAYWDDYVDREGDAAIQASNRAQIR